MTAECKCGTLAPAKQTPPTFWKQIRNYFRQYCNCTSIHGFRYFGEKRTYFERTWWFVVFSLAFAVCVYLIRAIYIKWERTPVIVSFATSETPIYTIPFPAVTICPESKTAQSVYNHSYILNKLTFGNGTLTEKENQNALYMNLLCDMDLADHLNVTEDYFTDEILDFLSTSTQHRRNETLFGCIWMGREVDCREIFIPILTDEGVCYSFNMLDREHIFRDNVLHFQDFMKTRFEGNLSWTLDDGYPEDAGLESYPRRALFAGAKNSLTIVLITWKDDIDYTCKESLQGYRVILHTPMRIPRPSQEYFRVPLNEVVLGSIQPNMITTSESVKVFNPRRRECYFPSERHLRYFKIYTQLNCHLECLTNFTLSRCGCVNFYMPRENGTSLCGAEKRDCMEEAEQILQTRNLLRRLQEAHKPRSALFKRKAKGNGKTRPRKNKVDFSCDCMPICTDLTYNVETSQSNWDWFKMYSVLNNGTPIFGEEEVYMSKLTLYFKTSQFVTSKRHELYGPTDFLANFGGLLGLFTGFSVLSLMEIFYFLTVRLCCNVRLYGIWSGPDELLHIETAPSAYDTRVSEAADNKRRPKSAMTGDFRTRRWQLVWANLLCFRGEGTAEILRAPARLLPRVLRPDEHPRLQVFRRKKDLFRKWEMSPVIVSFATTETQIYTIPFPAVTICSESKSIAELYNHSAIINKVLVRNETLNETEMRHFLHMSLVCDAYVDAILSRLNITNEANVSEDFFRFLDKNEMSFFVDCEWMGYPRPCEELFTPIFTDEGLCYAFNMLDRDEIFKKNVVHYKNFMVNAKRPNETGWVLDEGYFSKDIHAYPRRALYSGTNYGLAINLAHPKDLVGHSCKHYQEGYKISLHIPTRAPRVSESHFMVPLNRKVLVAVVPNMITTTDTVKQYPPERRECYFPSERNLKYFKIYTQLNCQLECLTNITLGTCKCVSFYMPRENGTQICGVNRKRCMRAVENILQVISLHKKINEKTKKYNRTESYFNCNCIPTCTDLTYNMEVSQSGWDWKSLYQPSRPFAADENFMSRLLIYFKSPQFVTSERHELYGPADFIANFGGLLGLFTGFSMLSLMEILYFLTVRLCCNVRLYGRWSGPEGQV
ncbi:uncharacterized protein LOC132700102 [Cylas formicarius]|uniref:uncharacterized protein LOC132700102 n=1 Tax=Cylas formicarius TaxID=197179 RepID=UPI0029584C23|nr:uncharacterized protein LOC132700102 [Cylas formicarius]